jgi:hypothetical protein
METQRFTDLQTAMVMKGIHPEFTLLVSLENLACPLDPLISDPLISAILLGRFLLLRVNADENPKDFEQFSSVFHISDIPSLIVFGPNDPKIAHSWIGRFPSKEEFLKYFRPEIANARPKERTTEPPRSSPKRQTKISAQCGGRTAVQEFPNNATVGELKRWLASEFGPDASFIVAHRQAPLPDDSLTLASADLTPSAALREAIELGDGHALPQVRTEAPVVQTRPVAADRFVTILKNVIALFNPWADDSSDEGWEYQPNPERAAALRRAARLMRGRIPPSP